MDEQLTDPSMLPVSERLRFFASGAALAQNDSHAERPMKPIGKLTLPQTFLNGGNSDNNAETAAPLRKIGKIKSPFLDNFQQIQQHEPVGYSLPERKWTYMPQNDQRGEAVTVANDDNRNVNVTVVQLTDCAPDDDDDSVGERKMMESNIDNLIRTGDISVEVITAPEHASDFKPNPSTHYIDNKLIDQTEDSQKIHVSGSSPSSRRSKENTTVKRNARQTQSLGPERQKTNANATKNSLPRKTYGGSSAVRPKSGKDDAKRVGKQKKLDQISTQPNSSKQAQSFGARTASHPGAAKRNVRNGGVPKNNTRNPLTKARAPPVAKENIEKQSKIKICVSHAAESHYSQPQNMKNAAKRPATPRADAGGRKYGSEKRK